MKNPAKLLSIYFTLGLTLSLMLFTAACKKAKPPQEPGGLTRPEEVWLAPNIGSKDTIALFTQPDQWPTARSKTQVIQVYAQNMIYDSTEDCVACGPNIFPAFVQSRAFQKMKEWGMKLALEGPGIKHYDCGGDSTITFARDLFARLKSVGATLEYYSMDSPLIGVHSTECKSIDEQTQARNLARIINAIRVLHVEAYPNEPRLQIGIIDPYPHYSAAELIAFVDKVRGSGATLDFFHLDLDMMESVGWLDYNTKNDEPATQRNIKELETYMNNNGITFGILFASPNWGGMTNRTFHDSLVDKLQHFRGFALPPKRAVFQSFYYDHETPDSLPESNNSLTSTLNDGLWVLEKKGNKKIDCGFDKTCKTNQ